jgi:predicted transcriptional regulator
MFGLGKERTKLGKWLDQRGMKQDWLANKSKLGNTTISNACGDKEYIPSGKTMQKIIRALKEVDPSARADKFWDV